MIRDVKLLGHLPPFIQEYLEIREIMKTENPEFQLVEDESEIIKNNQFIQSCNLTGISKFEKLIGIVPSADDTLESRINRVLVRWNDTVPYTLCVVVLIIMKSSGNWMNTNWKSQHIWICMVKLKNLTIFYLTCCLHQWFLMQKTSCSLT